MTDTVPVSRTPALPVSHLPKVLLFRGRGFISALIRWQTRGEYSHAAFLLPDGQILESWPGAGVRIKTLTDCKGIDVYDVLGISPEQWESALSYAKAQVGKKYDYWSVIRFVSRRNLPKNAKWFCSELVFVSLVMAGFHLFERVEGSTVSPAILAITPLLELSAVQTLEGGPLTEPGAEEKVVVT
jgi:hypothetical protein